MSKQAKRDRGALRLIVKEELPLIVTTEGFAQIRKEMNAGLDKIALDVQATLQRMQERQADLQSYIMREVNAATTVKVTPAGGAPDESK